MRKWHCLEFDLLADQYCAFSHFGPFSRICISVSKWGVYNNEQWPHMLTMYKKCHIACHFWNWKQNTKLIYLFKKKNAKVFKVFTRETPCSLIFGIPTIPNTDTDFNHANRHTRVIHNAQSLTCFHGEVVFLWKKVTIHQVGEVSCHQGHIYLLI